MKALARVMTLCLLVSFIVGCGTAPAAVEPQATEPPAQVPATEVPAVEVAPTEQRLDHRDPGRRVVRGIAYGPLHRVLLPVDLAHLALPRPQEPEELEVRVFDLPYLVGAAAEQFSP